MKEGQLDGFARSFASVRGNEICGPGIRVRCDWNLLETNRTIYERFVAYSPDQPRREIVVVVRFGS